jgi:hypothetical protein
MCRCYLSIVLSLHAVLRPQFCACIAKTFKCSTRDSGHASSRAWSSEDNATTCCTSIWARACCTKSAVLCISATSLLRTAGYLCDSC